MTSDKVFILKRILDFEGNCAAYLRCSSCPFYLDTDASCPIEVKAASRTFVGGIGIENTFHKAKLEYAKELLIDNGYAEIVIARCL